MHAKLWTRQQADDEEARERARDEEDRAAEWWESVDREAEVRAEAADQVGAELDERLAPRRSGESVDVFAARVAAALEDHP